MAWGGTAFPLGAPWDIDAPASKPSTRTTMFPKPRASLTPNTYELEALPVKPTGFREYDARWLFGEERVKDVGLALPRW